MNAGLGTNRLGFRLTLDNAPGPGPNQRTGLSRLSEHDACDGDSARLPLMQQSWRRGGSRHGRHPASDNTCKQNKKKKLGVTNEPANSMQFLAISISLLLYPPSAQLPTHPAAEPGYMSVLATAHFPGRAGAASCGPHAAPIGGGVAPIDDAPSWLGARGCPFPHHCHHQSINHSIPLRLGRSCGDFSSSFPGWTHDALHPCHDDEDDDDDDDDTRIWFEKQQDLTWLATRRGTKTESTDGTERSHGRGCAVVWDGAQGLFVVVVVGKRWSWC